MNSNLFSIFSAPTVSSNAGSILGETYFDSPIYEDTNMHICQKSINLDIQLQKAKSTIAKLQKKCADKVAEVNRLKAAEKRLRLSKCSLEEILRDLKEKKWISDEGENILNVIDSN